MSRLSKLHSLNLIPIYNFLFRSTYWAIRLVFVPNLNTSHVPITEKHESEAYHCVKSVLIRSFSGPLFPAFGLNTERYSASLLILPECGKIRTRKTPNTDNFHAVYSCLKFWILKTYLTLSPLYLIPLKEIIVLFPKAILCHNFRNVCLYYDDQDIHKPSFLTFGTLRIKKKLNFTKSTAIFDLWLMILKIDHFWHLKLWTLFPAHFFFQKLVIDENICNQQVPEKQNGMGTRLLNDKQNVLNK